jgi:hypothetical protein
MPKDVTGPQVADEQNGSSWERPHDDQDSGPQDAFAQEVCTEYTPLDPQADFDAAAELLLALAGPMPEHIEMARTGKAKYYTIKRSLTREDVLSHLRGGKARGALCCYPDNKTRGLGWDTDEEDGWQILQDAMQVISGNGYLPILEPSPAGRGGHAWIIFDDLVDADLARAHVQILAPALEAFKEYWPPRPDEAEHWNKVRLPGGRYTRMSVNAWCQLISVTDGEIATCGQEAAQLLLQHQTPARVVPLMSAYQKDEQKPEPVQISGNQVPDGTRTVPSVPPEAERSPSKVGTPTNAPRREVDPSWQARYNTSEGKQLWFAFTPGYVAAWYNEHHSVDELLPSEKNGYGLASWRGERTASVHKHGEQWTDFGASARRDDGSPDGGDALELHVRLSQTPKPEVMRQAARELLAVARTELEQAARLGQRVPPWLEEIITEAGYLQYARLATQGGHVEQAKEARDRAERMNPESFGGGDSDPHQIDDGGETWQGSQGVGTDQAEGKHANTSPMGGLSGFSSSPIDQPSKMPDGSQERPLPNSALAVPHSQDQTLEHDLIERYHLQHGEPCPKCCCSLYRELSGNWVCCRCLPQRGYTTYSDHVDQLYPRRHGF